jgi:VCBS repeat-containing protein
VTFAGGSVTYTPNANFNGTDSFAYTVSDGNGGTSIATVNVTVNPVNDAPVANNDTATTNEDTPVSVNVVANDSDVEGDSLTVSGVTQGANGTVTFADGSVTYTPNANFNGSDSFTYTVSDGNGGTATAKVSVTVNPINDTPVGLPTISGTATEDQTLTANTAGISDADGLGAFSYQWLRNGVAIGGATSSTYTLVDADVGSQISVQVNYTDGHGTNESVTSMQTAAVTNVNHAPVIGGDSTGAVTQNVDPDADGLLEVGGVLTISDPDVGESSFRAETIVGTYGSLTIDATGNWSYAVDNVQAAIQQLTAGERVTDVLTVTTTDGTTHSITITIIGAKNAPVIDPSQRADEGGTGTNPKGGVDPAPTVLEPKTDAAPSTKDELPPREKIYFSRPRSSDVPGITRSPRTFFAPTISRLASAAMYRNDGGSQWVSVDFLNSLKREPVNAPWTSQTEATLAAVDTEFFSTKAMTQVLDHIQQQIEDLQKMESNVGKLIIGAATGLGASVMVGYVVWALRGAALLLGALSAMPMWRCFDPLPVLIGKDKKREEDDKKKSGEQESEDEEKRVRDLLSSEQVVNPHQAPNGIGN